MKLPSSCVLVLSCLQATYSFVVPHGFNAVSTRRHSLAQERDVSFMPHQQPQERRGTLCMAAGRVPFIAGNWKMNPLELSTAKDLAKQVCS